MNDGIVVIEKQVLNCIWNNPPLVFRFDQNYFLSSVGAIIFDTIKTLLNELVEVNSRNVFAAASQKDSSITQELIDSLRQESYSDESFDYYFGVLKQRYAKDRIHNHILKETLKEAERKTDELDVERISELKNELQENLDLIHGKESLLLTTEQLFNTYEETLHERQQGRHRMSTGDSFLDQRLATGFVPGQITTLFAATGVGKSVFALSLISKQINKHIPSLYLSLEMDTISTMDRLISMRRRIPTKWLYPDSDGQISDQVFDIVEKERKILQGAKHFHFVEEPSLSLRDFHALIKEAQRRNGSKYLVATVDLLTMLKEFSGKDARGYEEAMNETHQIVKQTGIHLVAIVQANRSADSASVSTIEQLDRLRPSQNTIKNSGAIAERSRIILAGFRAKYYAERLFPDEPEVAVMDDILEIQVIKQSMGEVGSIVKYLYDGNMFFLYPFRENN